MSSCCSRSPDVVDPSSYAPRFHNAPPCCGPIQQFGIFIRFLRVGNLSRFLLEGEVCSVKSYGFTRTIHEDAKTHFNDVNSVRVSIHVSAKAKLLVHRIQHFGEVADLREFSLCSCCF